MTDRGILDLPAVVLDRIQPWLEAWLAAWLSLGLWALLAAFLSMRIYARLSKQDDLRDLKPRQKNARRLLAVYDGPFNGLMPLIRDNLALSGKHMWLTLYPALAATLPLLFILPWLSNTYGVDFPDPGTPVVVEAKSYAPYGLRWRSAPVAERTGPGRWVIPWPERDNPLVLIDNGEIVLSLPTNLPSPVIHKRLWWNRLLANPGGYLDADARVEEVFVRLPEKAIIAFGPEWLRGWLAVFLFWLILFSLFFRWRWRLH